MSSGSKSKICHRGNLIWTIALLAAASVSYGTFIDDLFIYPCGFGCGAFKRGIVNFVASDAIFGLARIASC